MARRDGRGPVSQAERVVSRSRPVDATLAGVLDAFSGPRVAWIPPDDDAIVGCGAAATVSADGHDRFQTVRERAASLLERADVGTRATARPRVVGGFAFHDAHEPAGTWRGFPGAYFVLPRVQVVRDPDADRAWLTVTHAGPDADPDAVESRIETAVERAESADTPDRTPPGVTDSRPTPAREGWCEQVEAATERIDDDVLRKVVLAASLDVDLADPFHLPDALARLSTTYRRCYRFAVQPESSAAFFGATPERLISLRGDRVETEALAGSSERGATPAEDDRLARALADSQKNRHEHDLVADAIRETLASVARVDVGDRAVRRIEGLQHLHTPIRGTLRGESAHVLSLVEALHPTPAVGGLPSAVARRTIREAEPFDRGWYAAPVGWFDADGDGSFAVGIRSAAATDDRATLFAGNGIVADSDPGEEWAEVELKFQPMLDHLDSG